MKRRPEQERRYFHVNYAHGSERPRLFQDRDGAAAHEVAAVLHDAGYRYGTLVYFYPDDPRQLCSFPELKRSDLLILTTRPPLDDHCPDMRASRGKRLPQNGSELEALIFRAIRKHLRFSTRQRIELTDTAARALKCDDARKWKVIEFRAFHHNEPRETDATEIDAIIKIHHLEHSHEKPPPPPPYRTVAFLVRENNVAGLGCDLVASFGMDGYTTLIWNRIVRSRYPSWLMKEGFVMAELIFEADIPARPLTPAFADDDTKIKVRLLT